MTERVISKFEKVHKYNALISEIFFDLRRTFPQSGDLENWPNREYEFSTYLLNLGFDWKTGEGTILIEHEDDFQNESITYNFKPKEARKVGILEPKSKLINPVFYTDSKIDKEIVLQRNPNFNIFPSLHVIFDELIILSQIINNPLENIPLIENSKLRFQQHRSHLTF